VVTHPRRGTFVYQLTKGEARDLVLFRAAVEGVAARTVAEKQPPEAIARLEGLVRELEDGIDEDRSEELRDLDIAFHQVLLEASGNRWVLQAWSSLHPFVWLLVGLVLPAPAEDRSMGPRHRRVLTALCSGDPDAAEWSIREHILGPESKLPVVEAWPGDDDAIVTGANVEDGRPHVQD
jgi:DNA-binding GntR family transcriptional regulator